jgi:hypothetical protein
LETETQMKEAARQIKEVDAEMIQAARRLKGLDYPAEQPGSSEVSEEVQDMVFPPSACLLASCSVLHVHDVTLLRVMASQ